MRVCVCKCGYMHTVSVCVCVHIGLGVNVVKCSEKDPLCHATFYQPKEAVDKRTKDPWFNSHCQWEELYATALVTKQR